MWPVLWRNPVSNLIDAMKEMSKFPWRGSVLYRSEFIRGTELPWHYSLNWIFITTPVLYLFLFGFGTVVIIRKLISLSTWSCNTHKMYTKLMWIKCPSCHLLSIRNISKHSKSIFHHILII